MYYKLIRGYDAEDFISITKDELEKAYYCFLTKKDAVYSGGAVRGSEIKAIQPDFHKSMGWNRGYRLTDLDYGNIRESGMETKLERFRIATKVKVEYLIGSKQEHLIGKNATIPELDKPINPEVAKIGAQLTAKYQIKK